MNRVSFDDIRVAILIVDGWRFHSTYDSRESALETHRNLVLSQTLPIVGWSVKPFGVHIVRIDPTTEEAIEWTKVEGWSVWTRTREKGERRGGNMKKFLAEQGVGQSGLDKYWLGLMVGSLVVCLGQGVSPVGIFGYLCGFTLAILLFTLWRSWGKRYLRELDEMNAFFGRPVRKGRG